MEITVSEELTNVLSIVGVTFTPSPEDPLILNQEQALVVRELSRYVESHVNNEFLKNLQNFCRSKTHFRKFLSPTKFQKAADNDTGFYQDSLFRYLWLLILCLVKFNQLFLLQHLPQSSWSSR